MKVVAVVALILASTIGAGVAADLETDVQVSSPRMYHKRYDWTGLYFGVSGGYGASRLSSDTNFTGGLLDGTTVSDAASLNGPLVGLQTGFNWQAGWFVFGGEVDGMWTLNQRSTSNIACGAACSAPALDNKNVKGFSTVRLRFGAAFDRIWVYATGGAAFVIASETLTMSSGGTTAALTPFADSKTGWTAGLGVEGAFWDHWSARLEYLYIDARSTTNTAAVPAAFLLFTSASVVETARYRENLVRVGVNYRFGP
jgi:outer membrane immunogenic protein